SHSKLSQLPLGDFVARHSRPEQRLGWTADRRQAEELLLLRVPRAGPHRNSSQYWLEPGARPAPAASSQRAVALQSLVTTEIRHASTSQEIAPAAAEPA